MILGVDGGGTRCRLALEGPEGRHQVEVGPANVFTDFDGALAEISSGIGVLASKARLSQASLYQMPTYLGLAGVTNDKVAESVAGALPFQHVRVSDDRSIALRGALGGRDGVLAHFGTGSFLAFQSGGRTRLAGGWGWQLGDQGSAYWVVRSALSATLDTFDGLRAASKLTRNLLHRYGSPGEIVEFCASSKPPTSSAMPGPPCTPARWSRAIADPAAGPSCASSAGVTRTGSSSARATYGRPRTSSACWPGPACRRPALRLSLIHI